MKKLLLRKESFGGTLCAVETGKRIHINQEEYEEIESRQNVSGSVANDIGVCGNVHIVTPTFLPENNFSFPDTVYFEVTRRCNLHCKQCFNHSGTKLVDELTLNRQLALVDEMARCGVQEIRFTGGEVLSHQGHCELIARAKNHNVRSSIGTNATLIDVGCAQKLADAGLRSAVVSIDGVRTVHDAIRGKGSFAKTLAGVQYLRNAGIDVRINTTVMRDNFRSIPLLARFFHRQGIRMFIRRLMPQGRARADWARIALSANEYAWLKTKLGNLLDNPDGIIYGHYLRDKRFVSRVALPFARRTCTIGQRAMVIEVNGDIGLCGFLVQERLRCNVQEFTLTEIWRQITTRDLITLLGLKNVLQKYNAIHDLKTDCYAVAHGVMVR